jgi:hypothetical protein
MLPPLSRSNAVHKHTVFRGEHIDAKVVENRDADISTLKFAFEQLFDGLVGGT